MSILNFCQFFFNFLLFLYNWKLNTSKTTKDEHTAETKRFPSTQAIPSVNKFQHSMTNFSPVMGEKHFGEVSKMFRGFKRPKTSPGRSCTIMQNLVNIWVELCGNVSRTHEQSHTHTHFCFMKAYRRHEAVRDAPYDFKTDQSAVWPVAIWRIADLIRNVSISPLVWLSLATA